MRRRGPSKLLRKLLSKSPASIVERGGGITPPPLWTETFRDLESFGRDLDTAIRTSAAIWTLKVSSFLSKNCPWAQVFFERPCPNYAEHFHKKWHACGPSWVEEFPWLDFRLDYSQKVARVFCKVCFLQGNCRGASWSTPTGLQKVHFIAHAGGKTHQLAMKDIEASQNWES